MKIKIICANDNFELAFFPGTPDEVIERKMEEIRIQYKHVYRHETHMPVIYVHVHEVELFDSEKK